MLKRIGPSFKKTLAQSYKDHKDGFYVYAKDSDVPTDQMIKYVGRYLGRPVIANSRIDKYDGDSVTFHYNRHEDDVYVEETIPAQILLHKRHGESPFALFVLQSFSQSQYSIQFFVVQFVFVYSLLYVPIY